MYSDEIQITDYWYYSTTIYSTDSHTTINVDLPSTFKVEFDIAPTSRSTSGWGSSSYLRIGTGEQAGIWVGQLTSAGKHGIAPQPSGSRQYVTSDTVLNTDNHITLTYDGTGAVYTCNNESVTVSASNLSKIVMVSSTANVPLKNIKVVQL